MASLWAERPILCCTVLAIGIGLVGFLMMIRPRAFLSLSLSAVRFDRSFASAGSREGIMAAVSSVSVLPLAPPRPLPLRRAARNVLEGGGRRASSPPLLLLARYGLRRGRPAAAAVAGEAELPLEEAEAAMRVAADDDSITATVVSVLLTVAFVGLSILTLGVRVCCDLRAVVTLGGRYMLMSPGYVFGWLTILFAMQVIYLSVQDFLQKREKEKFEKEEAERQKEEARKKRAKSRQKRRNY